ncbi:MAG: MFS transporter [Promethearchaeota archaeon]
MAEKKTQAHSKWIMASYGAGPALNQFFRMAFVAFGFYFYEGEVGLDVWLAGLGYIIFALWNAVNDPIVGYLTDRPFKFTKKWGRRFPWTMLGGIPWVLSYILIFTPPKVDPVSGAWIIFAWLVFSTCLFDTFNSIWWVNFYALFPDKFRSIEERRIASGIITFIGIIGITLGGLIPPLFIVYGDLQSFINQAVFVSLLALVILFLGIPGWRDDPESVRKYMDKIEQANSSSSFIRTFKDSFHQRSFIMFLLIYTSFQVLIFCIQSSVPYVVRFVLGKEASAQLLLQVGFLIGALVSIPFWLRFMQKADNNKKVYTIAGLLLSFFSIPISFFADLSILVILFIIWGTALGGFWIMERPILSDVIDNSVVRTGKREEGFYVSIVMFFNRLAIIIQVLIFAVVHTLTGFVEGADTQSPEAIFGIQLHFGFIPMFFILIATILFWKFYDLTPQKIEEQQIKLLQLKL